MLDDLDRVPWPDLPTAYGTAEGVPGALSALPGADVVTVRRMLGEPALAGLVHEGSVYPATVAALPFLVELASASEVPARGDVLALAVSAVVCEDGSDDVRRAAGGLAGVLVDLLDADDRVVRLGAATILGHCIPAAAAAGPALEARYAVEGDPAVRAATVVSATACRPAAATALVRSAVVDAHPQVRAAALYAVARFGLRWTPDLDEVAEGCLLDGDTLDVTRDWWWDPVGSLLLTVLGTLPSDDARRLRTTLERSRSQTVRDELATALSWLEALA